MLKKGRKFDLNCTTKQYFHAGVTKHERNPRDLQIKDTVSLIIERSEPYQEGGENPTVQTRGLIPFRWIQSRRLEARVITKSQNPEHRYKPNSRSCFCCHLLTGSLYIQIIIS